MMKTKNVFGAKSFVTLALSVIVAQASMGDVQTITSTDFENDSGTGFASSGEELYGGWFRRRAYIDTSSVANNDTHKARIRSNNSTFCYIATPVLTGNLGELSFDFYANSTTPDAVLTIGLTSSQLCTTALPGDFETLTNITVSGISAWTPFAINLDKYNVTNKYLYIGRTGADPSEPEFFFDNMVLKAAPSMASYEISINDSSETVVDGEDIAIAITETEVIGTISDVEVSVFCKRASDPAYSAIAMTRSGNTFSPEEPIAASFGDAQVQIYAYVTYENELGVQTVSFYSAENPYRIDVLPASQSSFAGVTAGWPAELHLVANDLWVGGMERADATAQNTYRFFTTNNNVRSEFGGISLLPPYQSYVSPSGSFIPKNPGAPDRDVVFQFNETATNVLNIARAQYGVFQTFENWDVTGADWTLAGDSEVAGVDAVSGANALYLGGTAADYIQTPDYAGGAYEVALWFRCADAAPVTVKVEKIVGGSPVEVGTAVCRSASHYSYASFSVADSAAKAVRITATGAAYIDDIIVTDHSSVTFSNVSVSPSPAMALLPISASVQLGLHSAPNISGVSLYYRYGSSGGFTDVIMSKVSDGNYSTDAIDSPVDNAKDLEYYVAVSYSNWEMGNETIKAYSATNIVQIIPYTSFDTMEVTGDLNAKLFASGNETWVGAMKVTSPISSPSFRFMSTTVEGTNYWGDSSIATIPAEGVCAEGEEFNTTSTISKDLIFDYDRGDDSYVIQSGYYEPCDSVPLSGFLTKTSGLDPLLETGNAVQGNALYLKSGTSDVRLEAAGFVGAGSIGFWAAASTNASAGAKYEVLVSDGLGSTRVAASGLISNTTFRRFNIGIGDRDAVQIAVKFKDGDVLVDEFTVTDVGAYIELSNGTFSYAGNVYTNFAPSPGVTQLVEYATSPTLGLTIAPHNGARIATAKVVTVHESAPNRTNSIDMAATVEENVWAVKMPNLASGWIDYWYEVTYDGIGASDDAVRFPSGTAVYKYYTSGDLSDERVPEVLAILSELGVTSSSRWTAMGWDGMNLNISSMVVPTEAFKFGPATVPSTPRSYMQTSAPMNGVGTVYFYAKPSNGPNSGENTLSVLVGNTAQTVDVLATDNYMLYAVRFNDYGTNLTVKIGRSDTNASDSFVYLTGIIVGPPPADVRLAEPRVIEPGYPSRNDDIRFELTVESCSAEAYPATDFEPELMWEWIAPNNPEAWQPAIAYEQDGDIWRAQIDKLYPQTGSVRYFTKVDFLGTAYNFVGTTNLNYVLVENNVAYDCTAANGIINENRSPAYLGSVYDSVYGWTNIQFSAQTPALDEMRNFEVRMFRSNHESFTVRRWMNGIENDYDADEMELVGDDTWQAIYYVTNAMNFKLFFVGKFPIADEESTYSRISDYFGYNPDEAQQMTVPPMDGISVQSKNTGDMRHIEVDSDRAGTLMFRLCTTNGQFQIRQAAAQNFNTWQASDEYFEESLGLFAVASVTNSFDEIPATTASPWFSSTFESVATNVISEYSDIHMEEYWDLSSAWVIQERKNNTGENKRGGNKAVMIKSGPGEVISTSYNHTDGRKSLKFDSRITFGGDDNVMYYRNGFALTDYRTVGDFTVNAISPAEPYVSIVPFYYDENNYYEYRISQTCNYNSANDYKIDGVRCQLFRVMNGARTVLNTTNNFKADVTHYNNGNANTTFIRNWQFWVDTMVVSAGVVRVETFMTGIGATFTNKFVCVDQTAGSMSEGGTIAFNVYDADVNFNNINIMDVTSKAGDGTPTAFDQNEAYLSKMTSSRSWYRGGTANGGMPTDYRWSAATQGSTGANLHRIVPSVQYGVYMMRNGEDPSMPTGTEWTEVISATCDSLTFSSREVPLKLWDYSYVKIRPEFGDANFVIDNLYSESWRGHTITDPYIVPSGDPNSNTVWVATEAYITCVTNGYVRENMLEFTRSRANPDRNQMIVSPIMYDGVGTISFKYKATGGKMRFVVERAQYSEMVGEEDPWLVMRQIEASPSADYVNLYLAVRTNMVGRIRVRVLNGTNESGTPLCDPGASLWIGNIRATSYPKQGNTSWEAYNVLVNSPISADKTETVGKYFEYDETHQTAFLNDSAVKDVQEPLGLTEHVPFIQSPEIPTGIGEISFWYRAWNKTGIPGKITLKMAPSADTPDEDWETVEVRPQDYIDNLELYEQYEACMTAIDSISNDTYEFFKIEIFSESNKVLRICGDTNNTQRVAIDNIVVTQPVRSSIDVLWHRFSPDIPLANIPVDVQVMLGNPRQNPQNIHVYLDYYIGTNKWGVDQWSQNPSEYVHDLELEQSATNEYFYTTSKDKLIPGLNVDDVVQWRVRVTYTGIFPSDVIYTGQTLENGQLVPWRNPEWYEPVDLNKLYGENGAHFSPYYFVFSCSTGTVFFNEFFYAVANNSYARQEYVELIGQNNAPIGNWMLDVVYGEYSADSDFVTNTIVIPSNARISQNVTTNGWAFYVLGDEYLTNLVTLDYVWPNGGDGNPSHTTELSQRLPDMGGLRLRRSMGAYVDRVSYGGDVDGIAATKMRERGYTYTATKSASLLQQGLSMELAVGSNDELSWRRASSAASRTIGYENSAESTTLWPLIEAFQDAGDDQIGALFAAISDIQLASGVAYIYVEVESTNGVGNLNGWRALVESSVDLTDADGWAAETGVSEQELSVTPAQIMFEVPYDQEAQPRMFFRIRGISPED